MRRMNMRRFEPRQLRDPAPHVVAGRIELLALRLRIEDAEVRRGVRAAARHPLPVQRIVREVGIHERVPEPARALQPVNAQVLHQERRDDHAHAVVHPAGRPQLAHACIHDRNAGAAPLPGTQMRSVARPREALEAPIERLQRRVREVIEQSDARTRATTARQRTSTRASSSSSQPARATPGAPRSLRNADAATAPRSRRDPADRAVFGYDASGFLANARNRPCAPASPGRHVCSIVSYHSMSGSNCNSSSVTDCGQAVGALHCEGARNGAGGSRFLQDATLVRRVDAIRMPAAVLDFPGLAQQRSVEAFDDEAVGTQLPLYLDIARNRRGFVAPIPEHRSRTRASDCAHADTSSAGPRSNESREPCDRKSASSADNERCSHQRAAPPGGNSRSSASQRM